MRRMQAARVYHDRMLSKVSLTYGIFRSQDERLEKKLTMDTRWIGQLGTSQRKVWRVFQQRTKGSSSLLPCHLFFPTCIIISFWSPKSVVQRFELAHIIRRNENYLNIVFKRLDFRLFVNLKQVSQDKVSFDIFSLWNVTKAERRII